jgi:ABC-type sugar transport system ATPase subunit
VVTQPPAVVFDRVTKRFPGVVAVDEVSFTIEAGACHALCGENGAGKSTIGRILAGIHAPDAGRVLVAGTPVSCGSPIDAIAAGVAMVHQELAFCDNLSVAENLCLGSLPATAGFVSRTELRSHAQRLLAGVGVQIDVGRSLGALSIGEQQLVQIAGAVGRGARLIVFDEPTSSLSKHEADRLYDLIPRLQASGVTCVYISHRLEEIFRLCSAVTVLRDGRHVMTQPIGSVDRDALVEAMIGRQLAAYFPATERAEPGAELLRVEGLSSPAGFSGVSFTLRAGEVLGLAGLVGAGRSQVAQAIFGLDARVSGRIVVRGQVVDRTTPRGAIARGIGLVPEDRKRQGLVLSMSVLANATIAILERFARLLFVDRGRERREAQPFFARLRLRTPRLDTPAAALSGGNQQKIVLTRWLAARCDILMLDEPTRGVDVGAKAEIHALIDELAASGAGVLLISSELPELINLSTRIVVLREGRVAGEVPRAAATQDVLMRLMAGLAA